MTNAHANIGSAEGNSIAFLFTEKNWLVRPVTVAGTHLRAAYLRTCPAGTTQAGIANILESYGIQATITDVLCSSQREIYTSRAYRQVVCVGGEASSKVFFERLLAAFILAKRDRWLINVIWRADKRDETLTPTDAWNFPCGQMTPEMFFGLKSYLDFLAIPNKRAISASLAKEVLGEVVEDKKVVVLRVQGADAITKLQTLFPSLKQPQARCPVAMPAQVRNGREACL